MHIADLSSVLSAQEWRVATAVGAGSTNKATARALGISAKTVEFHLSNVYRKLDILSRTELAHLVGRQSGRLDESPPPLGNMSNERFTLIGRDAEVVRLVGMVETHGLVTLTGVGGVGKTRLARAVAGQNVGRFRDGVWLVELGSLARGSDVVPAVTTTLGLTERESHQTTRDVAGTLARQQRLLLIDNCEHVLADAAELVAAIADRCPEVVVLTTSRERLDLPGEMVVVVPPLSIEGDNGVSAAVRLFMERSAAIGGSDDPSTRDLRVIDSLCRRLDGLPLAIELAAARAGALGVDEVHARLDDRFALLTRRHSSDAKHSSLEATIDWSYGLLTDPEQRVFESLSVFAGDFDLRAAVAIATGDDRSQDVAHCVASLVEKSMVVSSQHGLGRRYRLLETVREFAAARLVARGDQLVVRRQHLAHYCAFAHEVNAGFSGPDEFDAHQAMLADWHNVRTAMTAALALDDGAAACALLEDVFWWALTRIRGEVGDWSADVLRLPSAVDLPGRIVAIAAAAYFAGIRGESDRARRLLGEAYRGEERLGVLAAPWVTVVDGEVGPEEERYHKALETQRRARRSGNRFWETVGIVQESGLLGYYVAHFDPPPEEVTRCMARIDRAMEMVQELGTPNGIAFVSKTLGTALHRTDPDQARELLEHSLDTAEKLGIELLAIQARAPLTTIHTASGQPHDALRMMSASLELQMRTGSASELGESLAACVTPLLATGHPELAATIVGVVTRLAPETVGSHRPELREAMTTAVVAAPSDHPLAIQQRRLDLVGAAREVIHTVETSDNLALARVD